jgi:hypothetical protein
MFCNMMDIAFLVGVIHLSEGLTWAPPSVRLEEIHTPMAVEALQNHGILVVTGMVRGMQATGLVSLAQCRKDSTSSSHWATHHMYDGTLRRTIGFKEPINEGVTKTEKTLQSNMHFHCPDQAPALQALHREFRSIQQRIGHALNISNMLGDALDHFHIFSDSLVKDAANVVLPFHVDKGLFLVMTPGTLVSSSGEIAHSPALRIRLEDGTEVVPALPEDSAVILTGNGLKTWLGRTKRALPHAVEFSLPPAAVRAWFGTMALGREDIAVNNQTFNDVFLRREHRKIKETVFFESILGKGRSSRTKCIKNKTYDDCDDDDICEYVSAATNKSTIGVYCWTSCMEVPKDMKCGAADELPICWEKGTLQGNLQCLKLDNSSCTTNLPDCPPECFQKYGKACSNQPGMTCGADHGAYEHCAPTDSACGAPTCGPGMELKCHHPSTSLPDLECTIVPSAAALFV